MTRFSSASVILAVFFAFGCGDGGTGGAGQATGGTPAATGGTPAAGGAPTSGAGMGGQYVSMVNVSGSGQAVGGGDQGALFGNDVVPIMPPEMGGSGGGGPVIPGDGKMATSNIKGSINGTAVFSQKGEDVTVVVNFTGGCADGNHQFRIHDGYSCDNPTTEGNVWTPRGTGIGPDSGIACSGGKGTLTYTRLGADKTKNWTVADHVAETDLTAHVVIVSDEKDPNSRASCGNFF